MVLLCAEADEQNGTTYGSLSYFAIGYQINDSSGRKVSVKCNNDDLLQVKHKNMKLKACLLLKTDLNVPIRVIWKSARSGEFEIDNRMRKRNSISQYPTLKSICRKLKV